MTTPKKLRTPTDGKRAEAAKGATSKQVGPHAGAVGEHGPESPETAFDGLSAEQTEGGVTRREGGTRGAKRKRTMTKPEQETVIRWDQEERIAHLWTAYPTDARLWERSGYPVRVYRYGKDGSPQSWAVEVPVEAIRFRKVRDGQVVRRRGHRKGRVFGVRDDQFVASDEERRRGMADG